MGNWSIYVAPEDESLLKKKIQEIAKTKRWSFSQAISELLREHLIQEGKCLSDEEGWALLTARSFFEAYSEQDSVYDRL